MSRSTTPIVSRQPLIWLNIVCLDAPIVAISWQWLCARSFHAVPTGASRASLFLTAWLIYLVDRLVDSAQLSRDVPKSERQKFCAEHKRVWLALIAAVALLDAAIIFHWLDPETTVRGAFLGVIAAAYLAINLLFSRLWETLPLKEISVGCLFAAGTLLALVPQGGVARSTITFAALLFASLCALNCVSIAVWERDLDCAQGKHSIATRWPPAKYYAQLLPIFLAGACALLALLDSGVQPLAACLGISAILLSALHFPPIERDERTALADLVLLTPLAFLLGERFL